MTVPSLGLYYSSVSMRFTVTRAHKSYFESCYRAYISKVQSLAPKSKSFSLLLAQVWALGPASALSCHQSFSLCLLVLLILHSALESRLKSLNSCLVAVELQQQQETQILEVGKVRVRQIRCQCESVCVCLEQNSEASGCQPCAQSEVSPFCKTWIMTIIAIYIIFLPCKINLELSLSFPEM